MKIALFGGSFNPPHDGHIEAIKKLAAMNEFDEVWVIPSASHPFNKELAPFEARAHMLKLCIKNIKKTKVVTIENELPKPNRTIDMIHALKKRFPRYTFSFIIGSDILTEIASWKDYQKIQDEAEIIVISRKGFSNKKCPYRVLSFDLPDISSSDIRKNITINMDLIPLEINELVKEFYQNESLFPR